MKVQNFFILLVVVLIITYFLPLYKKPIVIHKFLTDEECETIKNLAIKKLKPSKISTNNIIDNNKRISETAWLKRTDDNVVDKLINKCVYITRHSNINNCEQLQVLRYKPGGFYVPHQDAFKLTEDKNRRIYTFIIALNDNYAGGETEFPNLNKKYKLEKGDALFFHTLNNYECITKKALHGGNPVISGEKWICNLWIRKYKY